VRKKE